MIFLFLPSFFENLSKKINSGEIREEEVIIKGKKQIKKICEFIAGIKAEIGKEKFDFSCVDLATFTAHKFYGIKGIGCLIKKNNIKLIPLIKGGKSTTIYRSGTPSPALIREDIHPAWTLEGYPCSPFKYKKV